MLGHYNSFSDTAEQRLAAAHRGARIPASHTHLHLSVSIVSHLLCVLCVCHMSGGGGGTMTITATSRPRFYGGEGPQGALPGGVGGGGGGGGGSAGCGGGGGSYKHTFDSAALMSSSMSCM